LSGCEAGNDGQRERDATSEHKILPRADHHYFKSTLLMLE